MSDKSNGGHARAEALSPERRREIARMGAASRWKTPKYGCHNQPRPTADSWHWGQDGWHDELFQVSRPGMTRMPRMVKIYNAMSTECRYDGRETDQKCAGCQHAVIEVKEEVKNG